jgi:ATP/maltotriose-dependent transcriptional regulator MalT
LVLDGVWAVLQGVMAEPLSEREIEVLSLVAEGLSNRQVAQRLVISHNTVQVHTSNIYGKLGAINRMQAMTKPEDWASCHLARLLLRSPFPFLPIVR